MANVGASENRLRKAAYGDRGASTLELVEERERGLHLGSRRAAVGAVGPGVRRDDIPEQDVLFEPELRKHAMDDGRGCLGRALAGELVLRGEGQPADARSAVAGRLADEEQR